MNYSDTCSTNCKEKNNPIYKEHEAIFFEIFYIGILKKKNLLKNLLQL